MRLYKNKKLLHLSLATFMAVSGLMTFGLEQAHAATPLGQVMVRFDRMAKSTFTSGMVCAMPSLTNLASVEAKVVVSFPTGFTVSPTNTDWTVDATATSSWPSGASAWPGITAPGVSDISGQDVTFGSGDLSSETTLYCFNWTNTTAALETPSSIGSDEIGTVATQTSGAAAIDSAQYATATVNIDQINVTATVPPIFNFLLGASSDPLGTLSSTSVTPSGTPITATIGTNAKNGWGVWAKSAATDGGLTSASAGYTIHSDCVGGTQLGTYSVLTAGTEGYNTGVTGTHTSGTGVTGTISLSSVFDGTTPHGGGGLCGQFQSLATSNGTAISDVLSLTNNVAINAATAAATDYTDTITVVGAGLF